MIRLLGLLLLILALPSWAHIDRSSFSASGFGWEMLASVTNLAGQVTSYDAVGNVITRTDARGITAS